MRQLLLIDFLLCFAFVADPAPAPTPAAPAIVRVPWSGAPKKIDPSVKLNGSEFELLTIHGATGPITWDATTPDSFALPVKIVELKPKDSIIGLRIGATEPDRYDAPDTPSVAVFAINTGRATLAAWGVKDGKPVKLATFQVDANRAPQPPPIPPEPKPPEPVPPPGPVTSFHVIFVTESGATLPLGQQSVMDAKAVRDYLSQNTTSEGKWAGWRQYDPQVTTANETPTFKALWDKVKGQITAVPCVVIEVNGKTDVLPFPATPADALTLFKKYGGK